MQDFTSLWLVHNSINKMSVSFGRYSSVIIWIFVPIFCEDVSGEIKHIEQERTWFGAQNYCKSIDGNLISPDSVERSKGFERINEEFWIGEFTTLSSWMDILGCYKTSLPDRENSVKKFDLDEPNPAICEQMCQKYSTVFGLKGKKCFCVKNMDAKSILGNATGANLCDNTCQQFPIGLCGGNDHYTMYQRNNETFTNHSNSYTCKTVCKCSVVECSTKVKNQASCETTYEITCRESGRFSPLTKNGNWTNGTKECFDINENLSALNATCGNSSAPVWTSTFRDYATLSINEISPNIIWSQNQVYTTCSSAKFINQSHGYIKNRSIDCNGKRMHFFCEINSYSSTHSTGIIIGSVVACILLASGVAVAILFLKYRKKISKQKEPINDKYEAAVNSAENIGNNGYQHHLANPISSSVPNHGDNSNSLVKHQDKINEIKKNDAGYELVLIPEKNESDYVYSDTVEGDYDQLNRKEGRKLKLTGAEDNNFYSHTNCHDGTYNTANTKSNTDDVCDTYNHAKISKRVVCDDNDPYDHTHNI